MTQYNREILSLYVKPEKVGLKNVVSRVTWRWTARDESDYADLYRDTYFESVDPNNYTDYQNLTDEIVFTWIDAVEDIEALQEELDQKLVAAKNPVILEKALPWLQEFENTDESHFLLVFDDQPEDVIKNLGPIRWNTILMNTALKENGVFDYEFPNNITMYQQKLLPVDSPVIVNDRVKLYRVEYAERPLFNEMFQYQEGFAWETDSGKAVRKYKIVDRTLEDVKNELKKQLANMSYQKQTSGTTITLGEEYLAINTDTSFLASLMQKWILMGEEDTIQHKINNNNTWITLTKAEVKILLEKIDFYIFSILEWEKNIFTQIEESETIDELKQIII